jgi:hypothetical protein
MAPIPVGSREGVVGRVPRSTWAKEEEQNRKNDEREENLITT